jgi:uncharacterized RDD family membrane protein YckC
LERGKDENKNVPTTDIGQTNLREEFTVQGMTGVDLSLQIAGPGSRAFAFLIDWHLRLLMALAWLLASMLLVNGGLRFVPGLGAWSVALIIGPALVIYFLYHPIVELAMHGQTPGKRMAGVRIVNREGGPPSAGAILARNAFRLIDAMPMLYVVGLACTIATRQHVRIGDMAAGTLLVVNDADASRSIDRLAARGRATSLDPAVLDVVEQLLERWKQIDAEKRGTIARALLQRIDADPARSPALLTDAQLHARLQALVPGGAS